MDPLIPQIIMIVVAGAFTAVGIMLWYMVTRLHNSVHDLHVKIDDIKEKYVSHPFCDERHGKR